MKPPAKTVEESELTDLTNSVGNLKLDPKPPKRRTKKIARKTLIANSKKLHQKLMKELLSKFTIESESEYYYPTQPTHVEYFKREAKRERKIIREARREERYYTEEESEDEEPTQSDLEFISEVEESDQEAEYKYCSDSRSDSDSDSEFNY